MCEKTFCMTIILLSLFSLCNLTSYGLSISQVKSVSLKQIGCLDFGVAYDVCVSEKTAYVTGNRGVEIIDVLDPESPKKLGRVKLRDGAFGVCVANDRAYIAGDKDGFFIADVSDPKNHSVIGSYSEKKGVTVNVAVKGTHAYVVMREGELLVLDIQNEKEPHLVEDINVGDAGTEIFLNKNFLYYSNQNLGLVVFDVSEPSLPKRLAVVPDTGGVFGIDIKEDLMFLGCHSLGLRILDISDPSLPLVKGTFSFSTEANYVVSNEYLYVADQNDGIIHVLDVSDHSQPASVTSVEGYMLHRMFYDGEYLYVADGKFGLVIYKIVEKDVFF